MPGARCTRSLACKNEIAHEVVTTGSPEQPGIPRAMVLTAYFVLFPVTGLVCHRRLREIPASLMPASGHQNHTTSPSASARFVKHAAASTASRANVRDDRETPLCVGRDGATNEVI